jgi:hypothetical protein
VAASKEIPRRPARSSEVIANPPIPQNFLSDRHGLSG